MTENSPEEDILLKLSMAGKSLRMRPQDAPKLPEQQTPQPVQAPPSQPSSSSPQQTLQQPISAPASSQDSPPVSSQPQSSETYQPQRETNTIVPPANTPPQSEEAQEDILRKLTMKPKNYDVVALEMPKESSAQQPPPGSVFQTPEEARSNRPFVSSEHEIERVRNLTRNIYGSDLVRKRTQKK